MSLIGTYKALKITLKRFTRCRCSLRNPAASQHCCREGQPRKALRAQFGTLIARSFTGFHARGAGVLDQVETTGCLRAGSHNCGRRAVTRRHVATQARASANGPLCSPGSAAPLAHGTSTSTTDAGCKDLAGCALAAPGFWSASGPCSCQQGSTCCTGPRGESIWRPRQCCPTARDHRCGAPGLCYGCRRRLRHRRAAPATAARR